MSSMLIFSDERRKHEANEILQKIIVFILIMYK
jgi:hypothetical protein